MRETLERTMKDYDFALIDVAPILGHDPRTINPLSVISVCDCVLMICEPEATSRASMSASLEQIKRAGGKVDGIILNESRKGATGAEIAQRAEKLLKFFPNVSARVSKNLRNSDLLN